MTEEQIRDFIKQAIDENQVMLFMKGTPDQAAPESAPLGLENRLN